MIDFLKQLLSAHFDAILYTVIGVVAVALVLLLKLFHELRTDPEATRRALRTFRGLIGMFKPTVLPKPGERDPLAETQTPFKAVPPMVEKETEL